ncbi:hypothetical protein H6G89_16735 [Oscillatoria sp. FACHB-1407]|uniref:hypothetical protein n=1 Tax=Oscillatoria sp. FACHB-1407 TaxID=2692847 RepID=UPI00168A2A5A|nr:hypothetical protein [Oscillatoria sp. FACHB-1407]MBD2462688.1 hypothetical protein [Oscillatoria sp. FACHB-1407]
MAEQNKTQQDSVKQEELSEDQLKAVAGGVRPPSGDSNPSDLNNPTVDTSDIINPHAK